jgi:pyruvate dehydrogenase E1 component beta subunit
VTEIGRAAVLKPGRDVTIVGYSRAAVIALDVARRLEDDGISAEVIDLRSLRPLDRDTICASVRKTSRAVIVEDDWLSYGTGAEIAATIAEGAFDYLDAPVRRVAAAEVPLPYAKPLELAALPGAAAITRVIRETVGGNWCPMCSCPGCRTRWRKESSASGSSMKVTRSARATCWR